MEISTPLTIVLDIPISVRPLGEGRRGAPVDEGILTMDMNIAWPWA